MTKAELIDQVAAIVQFPKPQTETLITQCLQAIMNALQAGETVELHSFGRFRLRDRQARAGRNPRTGDTVRIPAKVVPSFSGGKPSKRWCKAGETPQVTTGLATRRRMI